MKGQGNGNPLSQTEKRLYNLKEAAIYLGRTVWGMRGLVYAGKITYVKDSRRFYSTSVTSIRSSRTTSGSLNVRFELFDSMHTRM